MSNTKDNEQNRQSDKSANSSYEPATPSQNNDLQESGERKKHTSKKIKMNGNSEKTAKNKASDVLSTSPTNTSEVSNRKNKPQRMKNYVPPTILPEPPSQGNDKLDIKISPSKSMHTSLTPPYRAEMPSQKTDVSKDKRSQSQSTKPLMPTILSQETSPRWKEEIKHRTVQFQSTKSLTPSFPKDNKSPHKEFPQNEGDQKKSEINYIPPSFPSDKSPKRKRLTKNKKDISKVDSPPLDEKDVSPTKKKAPTDNERRSINTEAPLSPTKKREKDLQSISKLLKMSLLEKIKKENIQAGTIFINAETSKRNEQVKKIQEIAKSVIVQSGAMPTSASRSSTSVTDIDPSPTTKHSTSPKDKHVKPNDSIKTRSVSEPRKKSSVADEQTTKKSTDNQERRVKKAKRESKSSTRHETRNEEKESIATNDGKSLRKDTTKESQRKMVQSEDDTIELPLPLPLLPSFEPTSCEQNQGDTRTSVYSSTSKDNLQQTRRSPTRTEISVKGRESETKTNSPKIVPKCTIGTEPRSLTIENPIQNQEGDEKNRKRDAKVKASEIITKIVKIPTPTHSPERRKKPEKDKQSPQIEDLFSISDCSLHEDDLSLSTVKHMSPPPEVARGEMYVISPLATNTNHDVLSIASLGTEHLEPSKRENGRTKDAKSQHSHAHGDNISFGTDTVRSIGETLGICRDEPAMEFNHFESDLSILGASTHYYDNRVGIPREVSSELTPPMGPRLDYSTYKAGMLYHQKCSKNKSKIQPTIIDTDELPRSDSQINIETPPAGSHSSSTLNRPMSIRVVGTGTLGEKSLKKKCCKKKKKSDDSLKPSKSRSMTCCPPCENEAPKKKRRSKSEESGVEKGCKAYRCTPRCDDKGCPGRGGGGGGGGSFGQGRRGLFQSRCAAAQYSGGIFTRLSTAVGCQLQYLAGNRGIFRPPHGTGFYRPDFSTTGWLEHLYSDLSSCSETTTACQERREKRRHRRHRDDDDTDSQVETMPHDESDLEDHRKHSKKSKDFKREIKKASTGKTSPDKGGKKTPIKSSRSGEKRKSSIENRQAKYSGSESRKTSKRSSQDRDLGNESRKVSDFSQQDRDSIISSRRSFSRKSQDNMDVIEEATEPRKSDTIESDAGEEEAETQNQQTGASSRRSSISSPQQIDYEPSRSSVSGMLQSVHYESRKSSIREPQEDVESWPSSIRGTPAEIESRKSSRPSIRGTPEEFESRRPSIRGTPEEIESRRTSIRSVPEEIESRRTSIRSVPEEIESRRPSIRGTPEEFESRRPSIRGTPEEIESRRTSIRSVPEEIESRRPSIRGTPEEIESHRPSIRSVPEEIESRRPSIRGTPEEIESRRPSIRGTPEEFESRRPSIRGTPEEIESRRPSIRGTPEEIESRRPSIRGTPEEIESRRPSIRSVPEEIESRRSSIRSVPEEIESHRSGIQSVPEEIESRRSSIRSVPEEIESRRSSIRGTPEMQAVEEIYERSIPSLEESRSLNEDEQEDPISDRFSEGELNEPRELPGICQAEIETPCFPECTEPLRKYSCGPPPDCHVCDTAKQSYVGSRAESLRQTQCSLPPESPRPSCRSSTAGRITAQSSASGKPSHSTRLSSSTKCYRQSPNTTPLGSARQSYSSILHESVNESVKGSTTPVGSVRQPCDHTPHESVKESRRSSRTPIGSSRESFKGSTNPVGSVTQSCGCPQETVRESFKGNTTPVGSGRHSYDSIPKESVKESPRSSRTHVRSARQSHGSIPQESVSESFKGSTHLVGSVTQPCGCAPQESVRESPRSCRTSVDSAHHSYGSIPQESVKGSTHLVGSVTQPCGCAPQESVRESPRSCRTSVESAHHSYGSIPQESVKGSTHLVGSVIQPCSCAPQDSVKELFMGSHHASLKQASLCERIENTRITFHEDSKSEYTVISQPKHSGPSPHSRDFQTERLVESHHSERAYDESPTSTSNARSPKSPGPTADRGDKDACLYTHPQTNSFYNSLRCDESPPRRHDMVPSVYDCGPVYRSTARQPCDYRSYRSNKEYRPPFQNHSAERSTSRSVHDEFSPPRKSRYLQRLEQNKSKIPRCRELLSPSADRCGWLENMESSMCKPYPTSCIVQNKQYHLLENESDFNRLMSRNGRKKSYKRSASFSKYSRPMSMDGSERSRTHHTSKTPGYSTRGKSQPSCSGSYSMTSTECMEESNIMYSRLSTDDSNSQDQSKSKSSRCFEHSDRGSSSDVTTCRDGEGSCTASCVSDTSETDKDGGHSDSHEDCDCGDTGDNDCKEKRKIKGRILIRNPKNLKNTEICLKNMKIKMECRSYEEITPVNSHENVGQYEARNKTSNRRKNPDSDSDKGTSFSYQSQFAPEKKHQQHDNGSRMKESRTLTLSQKLIDLPSEPDSGIHHPQPAFPPKHLERLRMKLLPEQKIDCFHQIITPEQPTTIRAGRSETAPSGYFDDSEGYGKKIVGNEHSFYSSHMPASITPSHVQAEYDEIRKFGKCLLDDAMLYTRRPGQPLNGSMVSKDDSSLFDTEFDDIASGQSMVVWSKDKNASSSGNNNQSSLADLEDSDKGQVYYSNGIKEAIKTFNTNLLSLSKNEPLTETVDLDHIRMIPDMVQPQKEMFSIGDLIDPSEANNDDPKIVYKKIRENSFRALMYATTMANVAPVKTFNLSAADFSSMEESIASSNPHLTEDSEDKSIESNFMAAPERHDVGIQVKLPKPLSDLTANICEIHFYDPKKDKFYSCNSTKHTQSISHEQQTNCETETDVPSLASFVLKSIARDRSKEKYIKKLLEIEKNHCINSLLCNTNLDHLQFHKIGVENEVTCDDNTVNTQSFTDYAEFRHDDNNVTNITFEETLVINNQSFQESILSSADVSISSKIESLGKDFDCSTSTSFTENSVNEALKFDILSDKNIVYSKPHDSAMLDIASQTQNEMNVQGCFGGQIQGQGERRKKNRFPVRYKTTVPVDLSKENVFNPSQFVKECLEKEIENALDKIYVETCHKMGDNSFEQGIKCASSNNANQTLPSSCNETRVWEQLCGVEDSSIEDPLTDESLLVWLKARLRQEIGKLVSRFDWSAISQNDTAMKKSALRGSSVDFCNAGSFGSPCSKIHFCGIPTSYDSTRCCSKSDIPFREKIRDLKLFKPNKSKSRSCKSCHSGHQKRNSTCSSSSSHDMKLNEQFNESFAKFMSEMKCKKAREIDAEHIQTSNTYKDVVNSQDKYEPKCGSYHSNIQCDTHFPNTYPGIAEITCDPPKIESSVDRECLYSPKNNLMFKSCTLHGDNENAQKESSVDRYSMCTGINCQDVRYLPSSIEKGIHSKNVCGKSHSYTILNADPNRVQPINCSSAGSLPTSKKPSSMRCKQRRWPATYSDNEKCNVLEADVSYVPFVSNTYKGIRNSRTANDSDQRSHATRSISTSYLPHDFKSSFMRNKEPNNNSWKNQIYESLGHNMNDPAEAFVKMYLSMESRSRIHDGSRLTPINEKDYSYGTQAASCFINSLTRKSGVTHSDGCCTQSDAISGDFEKKFRASPIDRNGNMPLYSGTDRSREKAKGDIWSNRWSNTFHPGLPYAIPTRSLGRSYSYRNWNQSANNGAYDSPSQESPSESSVESDDGMVVDRVPFVNMCLSDVTSNRGINRSEAVLDLPSLCKKELPKKTSNRFPFFSKLNHWKKRESQYNEPCSEPIYQTPRFRRRENQFSDFARKNLNGSGNVIRTLSRDDLVKEDGDDILEGSEEDYHSAEEEMASYPPRSSEVDVQKPHYLCPHHLTDMCNHRQFSLADECSRMQLQDLCRNCSCLLKYCQGMKRELISQHCKASNNRDRMNNKSEAMCFSNNRSEQEDRNLAFPFYTTLSEKCRGQPKIFEIGGGVGKKHVPNTIKDFVSWYVSDDEDKESNGIQSSVRNNKQSMCQYNSSNKSERNENCPVNTNGDEVSQTTKEDPTAHGDVQNTNYKSKSTASNCDVTNARQEDNAADASSSSYEDTDEDDCDLTSIENVGYRMLKGLVESRLYGEKHNGSYLKESKNRNIYRETMRRSRAPLKRQMSKLKRSRAINKFINDDGSFIQDKTHRIHHKESHGDVWDSTSLEDIQVPQVDKGRVRFACDKNGEWAEVGRGSYGCVYLGLLDGEIEVAIKDFYESNSYDHVIHEARMLVYLQGTGITPKFYGLRRRFDTTKQPGEYCIIMEYFGDGKTLFNVLSEKIDLTTTEWLDVLGQLVAGLRLIHRRNVLINDLKADNILIDLNSARKTIRYIDVGMATYKQGLTFQLPQNQMGKYNFLAPEVRDGLHTSKRSDVYSLGYMLDQIRRVAGAALNGLDSLVSQCMRDDPKKRPYIDEIVAKVHRFVKTTSVARPISERNCIPMSNSV